MVRGARVLLVVVVATALVAAGAGCAGDGSDVIDGGGPGTRPATTGAPLDQTAGGGDPDPVPTPLAWRTCRGELQCAELTVPIDYDDAAAGTVDLSVIRRLATDQARRVGSLVVNPGGPGGSGVDMVANGYGSDGLDERLDIVGWDPRGTNRSAALDCAFGASALAALDPSPNDDAAQRRLDQTAEAIADDCARNGGPLLAHMDTDDTARDLEQLRLALGGEPLTYHGYSYGTSIGLAYADRYPTHIRAMVLDGVVAPDQDLGQMLLGQTVAFDRELQRTLDDCDDGRRCPVRDASATYDRVGATVEQAPLPTSDGRRLGPDDLATAAIESAYDPALTEPFLDALADADRGDGSAMMGLADQYRGSARYSGYVGVLCADAPHPVGAASWEQFADELAARSPRLGAAIANEVLPCAFWPVPVERQPHPVEAVGSPPILVIGNTGDPATPYDQAETVAGQLHDAVLLTVDARGHTSGGNACAASIVARYLVELEVPPAGRVCR